MITKEYKYLKTLFCFVTNISLHLLISLLSLSRSLSLNWNQITRNRNLIVRFPISSKQNPAQRDLLYVLDVQFAIMKWGTNAE